MYNTIVHYLFHNSFQRQTFGWRMSNDLTFSLFKNESPDKWNYLVNMIKLILCFPPSLCQGFLILCTSGINNSNLVHMIVMLIVWGTCALLWVFSDYKMKYRDHCERPSLSSLNKTVYFIFLSHANDAIRFAVFAFEMVANT